jgi:DNA-binding NarL/FixJ family response regulator
VNIKVLIADDEAMIRGGFAMILQAQQDIDVCGEAADGVEAVDLAQRLRPDVVVMDIQMPRRNGIAATRDLRASVPATRILIVTTFDIDEYVYEALHAGASGFLLKNAAPEELVRAVRVIASGDALTAPTVTRRLIEQFCQRPAVQPRPPALDTLTDRELEVLRLVAAGLSNQQIAERLVIGRGTVKTHVAHILAKLDISDRVQAVVLAYEAGLIRVQP